MQPIFHFDSLYLLLIIQWNKNASVAIEDKKKVLF